MTDLASLGIRVEGQQADAASASLDKLALSADRAERATDGLTAGSAKADGAIAGLLASIDRTTKEMLELSRLHQQAGGAALVQAGATEKLTTELNQASTAGYQFYSSFKVQQTAMEGATKAARDYAAAVGTGSRQIGANDAHMVAYRSHLRGAANEMKAASREGLGLTRQLADIAVTGFSGMSVFMIALQQGPQLFDIFQEKAIRTNTTIREAFYSTATAGRAAIAPFIPLTAAIAAVAAVTAGSWLLATRAQSREIGDLTVGMGLNAEQLDRLKEKNISTTATAGDVWRGLGTTIKEVFASTFGEELDWADKQWNSFLDDLTKNTGAEVDAIAGFFTGAYYVVRDTWKLLPAAIGDAAVSSANAAIRAINWLVEKSRAAVNDLREWHNSLPAWMRDGQVAPTLGAARGIAEMANPHAGGMDAIAATGQASYQTGYDSRQGMSGRMMDTLRQNTRDSGQARLTAGAGDAGDSSDGAGRRARELVIELQELPNIDLQPLNIGIINLIHPLQLVADEMRLVNSLAQESAQGMASAFGESGRALGDLLVGMTAYQSRIAEINLAEKEHQLSVAQATRERAHAQINTYGDMLGAAKGFFAEGSDGYRALQAAEGAYRAFSFAMSVQAMIQSAMETTAVLTSAGIEVGTVTAAEAAKTAATMAGTAIRTPLKAAEGAASMFAALGPFAFPVVAAMLTLLAGLGMKGKGGGGGGGSSSVQASVATSQGLNQQADQTRTSLVAATAQQLEVRITADREGLNAYVAQTAEGVARPMVAQGMAASAGATRAQVMSDLDKGRTYGRVG